MALVILVCCLKSSEGALSLEAEWNISVCGLNCAECDIFRASHGDEKARQEIVDWFREKRNQHIELEKIRCKTCRGPTEANWSSDCAMLKCAKGRKVNYCFECESFPCETVKAFASDGTAHHRRTVENMMKAKEIGLDAWIEEQKRKGSPSFCP